MHNQIQLAPAGLTDALFRNAISEITQPFQRYIEGWHLRATYLVAQLAVHPVGSDEHDLALKRLGELKGEVGAGRDYLLSATSRLAPDYRADATLDELEEVLAAINVTGPRDL